MDFSQLASIRKDSLSQAMEQFVFYPLAFGRWKQGPGIPDARRSLSQHYKLTLVAEGAARFSCSSGTHVLHGGDVVLMAPFIPYEVRMDPEDGLDMFYLYFEVTPSSSLPVFSQLFPCTGATLYPGMIDQALRIMLEQNLDLYQRGTSGQFLSLQLLLTRLMLVIRQRSDGLPAPRRAAQVSNGERVVQECVEYLDEHMRENVQVQDLCKAANVSQSYLYKCFDQVTGMSTREFIRRYRMPQIEMQLRQENLSIQQIAEQNGFSSASAFSRMFHNQYGISPAAYRKRSR